MKRAGSVRLVHTSAPAGPDCKLMGCQRHTRVLSFNRQGGRHTAIIQHLVT
jgi:hypothetical protein